MPPAKTDQPAHQHSLIRVFAVHSVGSLGPIVSFMQTAKTDQTGQIGVQVILLVLSCSGLFALDNRRNFKCRYAD